ncbi:TIGR00366 family protein [Nocardia seriolae]|nr:TIGR00366 family protein [Nocardia seriolae]WKY53580.1 TIGR00366 family protein [Nocardia seriolae]BAW09750.1 short chain fatty acid transporter [Nocardia seriolae]
MLDFGHTIFTWQSLFMCAILMALTVAIAYFSAPRGTAIETAQQLRIDLDDEPTEIAPRSRPGEWLEYSRILPTLTLLMTAGWLISQLTSKPVLSVISNLNGYLLVSLMLGLALHGTPRKFLQAVSLAVPVTAGILVQYPLYAAIAAILAKAKGRGGRTLSEHLATFFTNLGGGGSFAVVVALYTVVLGVFIPSGGGKWLIESPFVMQSSTDVGMNLGWTVQIYNVAEALPNLINPFFMVPLLAVLRLRARDLVGFTFLQFIIHLPVVLLLVRLLGMTFDYVSPILPATP